MPLDDPQNHEPPPPTQGPLRALPSWIDYSERNVDTTSYHIGDGFLEVGCFVMLIGQSYVGKSTLLAQLTINFAIGQSWLFFHLSRPLRVLIVQAEDPENKLIKMGQMVKVMNLNKDQIKLVHANTAVLTIRDLQDTKAIQEVELHANAFKPDILCVNPLTSYLSQGVYKDETINKFLRVDLTPMLDRVKCSAIVVHHPPKPIASAQELKKITAFELQYGGAGMAALTNAPRGNIFLTHIDESIFRLAVGKGFDDLGCDQTSAFLHRSKPQGIMHWAECTKEQAEAAVEAESKRKKNVHGKNGNGSNGEFKSYDILLTHLSPNKKYTRGNLEEVATKKIHKGNTWVEKAIQTLVFEKKLLRSTFKIPHSRTRNALFHLPTPAEPEGTHED